MKIVWCPLLASGIYSRGPLAHAEEQENWSVEVVVLGMIIRINDA